MLEWLKANKMYLFLGVLIVAALVIYYFMPVHKENEKNIATEWEDSTELLMQEEKIESLQKIEESREETMMVDVKGAVVKPGVYEAQSGDRVIDIIHMAGGLLENADQNQINFAMKVSDEMVLYLPKIGEEEHNSEGTAPNFGSFTASSSENGKVNLNTASESELQTLTGIGPSKAAAIIEYRDKNGAFKEIEQLKEISGIGDKTFEKLKENITVR